MIGLKTLAAETVGILLVFQFLDSILRLAALGVYPVIDEMRRHIQVFF